MGFSKGDRVICNDTSNTNPFPNRVGKKGVVVNESYSWCTSFGMIRVKFDDGREKTMYSSRFKKLRKTPRDEFIESDF